MRKKFLAAFVVVCLCTGSALAAYGSVYCDVQAGGTNSLYWADDGTLKTLYRTACRTTSLGHSEDVSDTVNIYAKASVVDYDSGEVYETAQSLDHYVTKVSAKTDCFERKEEDCSSNLILEGLSRIRYTDDTVSEDTNALVQWFISPTSAVNTENICSTEGTMGSGEAFETHTLDIISDRFSLDLADYSYIAFVDIWKMKSDSLSPDLLPLKSILTDIFVEAQKGDHLPLGILYCGTSAYTLQELSDGKYKLAEYKLGADAVSAYSSENNAFHTDYSIVNVAVK